MSIKELEKILRGINKDLNVENVIDLITKEKEQDKIIYPAHSR